MLTGACSTLRPVFSKLHHVASGPEPDMEVRRLRSPPRERPCGCLLCTKSREQGLILLGKRHYHCPQLSKMFRGPSHTQAHHRELEHPSDCLSTQLSDLRKCYFFCLKRPSHLSVQQTPFILQGN